MKAKLMKRLIIGGISAALLATAVAIPASAEPSWTMPNLIGSDLQGAQDAIQSVSDGQVWLSTSTDLSGEGRAQIVDRNWTVCTSTPAPGVSFTATTAIDFGVVRDTETCP